MILLFIIGVNLSKGWAVADTAFIGEGGPLIEISVRSGSVMLFPKEGRRDLVGLCLAERYGTGAGETLFTALGGRDRRRWDISSSHSLSDIAPNDESSCGVQSPALRRLKKCSLPYPNMVNEVDSLLASKQSMDRALRAFLS